MCVCVPDMCLVAAEFRVHTPAPLELELSVVAGHHVGSGNQTWILCKNSQCSDPLTYLFSVEKGI